jgi:hypothetical protein
LILTGGPDALAEALRELASAISGANDASRKAFGGFYDWLEASTKDDERYNPFRGPMRKAILDAWPVRASEPILGVPTRAGGCTPPRARRRRRGSPRG